MSLLERILASGGLSTVFQPVFDIGGDRQDLHLLECLTRGPAGSNAASAAVLFEYVRAKRSEPVVDRACVTAALQQCAALPRGTRIALNVHASTLSRDVAFCDHIEHACRDWGIDPQRLVVEIVEHSPYWDGASFAAALSALRAMGSRIALDDVGLGHSNYRMILDCSPDYLKIDSYFVRDAASCRQRRAIVASIRDLASAFDSLVVVEGVETSEDMRTMQDLGITLMQGKYFCGPLVPRDLATFLAGTGTW